MDFDINEPHLDKKMDNLAATPKWYESDITHLHSELF